MKRNIVVFSNGSFGDGSIAETILSELVNYSGSKQYNIVYIANRESVIPGGTKPNHTFSLPKFILDDRMLGPADSNQSVVTYFLNNIQHFTKLMKWAKDLRSLIQKVYKRYKPVAAIYHFSMLPIALQIEYFDKNSLKIGEIPTFVFYYVPTVANKTIPWAFDSRLRDSSFKLYDKNHESNVTSSWETILNRFTTSSFFSVFDMNSRYEFTEDVIGKLNHLLMWPPSMIKAIRPMKDSMRLQNVGLNMLQKSNHIVGREIKTFIRKSKLPVAFISFGSFGKNENVQNVLYLIVRELKKTHALILHKTWKHENKNISDLKNRRDCLIYSGFVAYDKIVPLVSLVIGSGSLGLQSYTLLHTTPMMMVPIITEQYFWAKNYQFFTGVSYVDIDKPSDTIAEQVKTSVNIIFSKNGMVRSRVMNFLDKVSHEMKNRDPFAFAKNVVRKIETSSF